MVIEVKSFSFEERISTKERVELIDITTIVEESVRRSGIRNGFCLVYAPHATAAIIANENEGGLVRDIVKALSELFPRNGKWLHNRIDDNAAAHIASSIISSSRIFPVIDGRLVRGTWQNIFFVELDGPRGVRRILIQVIGE